MSSSERLILQERDKAIFIFIGEHETASFQQLRDRFWSGTRSDTPAIERLNRLCQKDYLARFDYWPQAQRKFNCYRLLPPALRELPAEIGGNLYAGKELLPRQVAEALAGVAVRLELEKQGYRVVGWVSGRRLMADAARELVLARGRLPQNAVADGQVLVVSGPRKIETLDVEIQGAYYGLMLRDKIAGYGGRKIIWATTAENFARVKAAATPNIRVVKI